MNFIYAKDSGKRVKRIISKSGSSPEHSYHYHCWHETKDEKPYFAVIDKYSLILARHNKRLGYWEIENGIVTPEDKKAVVLLKFLDRVFKNKKTKKVIVETTPELRKELLWRLKRYKIGRVNYDLIWPIYHLPTWDNRLKGKKWKKVRNLINRLKSGHRIRVVNSKDIDKKKLYALLKRWIKKRNDSDRVCLHLYENIIKNNFKGMKFCRTVMVDGEPCTITAGWKIPNSNNYYSAIGIINYKYEGLGEFANVDDLRNIKKHGFEFADFGGSDGALLKFKKKFKPVKTYKTVCYSIRRK